jgi:hypothetical protein
MAQVCGGGPVADYSEFSGSREGYERIFQLWSDSLMLWPWDVACSFKLIAVGIFIELGTRWNESIMSFVTLINTQWVVGSHR